MSDNSGKKEEFAEEETKFLQLRTAVNLTKLIILQGEITYGEALKLVENLRSYSMKLFPEKEETFELVYRGRFNRIMDEKYKYLEE
ncbi:MAG: hypothetical protein A3C43_10750 [Candidatus Schekmanbacteria bacterium RIFCSPHIGHO2_02_FULL_38_11]|uniref:Uncharacterized protein n=1 Tax=Candidatus Schekmanbacteria bacterium RIFCSPLOWO2_12_FULL_38_15 TaxID=1817883 RepID=A0A1F7SGV2_9BACT|nr:MAG: hypothetical protein A2043_00255 [Candidatus Schekmanbacteria bacterium GWA2_38_9]OGL49618.1 MAG: hypothetical protein A3H37_01080 [Candidatus Schekmanbacteria bacterium RIFCSPLOWO2_02_FULL_38_14]OGL50340.1 MAG: hypothetical protein A3C43_10750 [Candidatus Schekmanbacteria bacterium RIFCSPHIGHO2_02_FULL_38_11]OGL52971.1 MAG: hypothetical protein A3G31_08635 [Candidatus Schekmanbacteria bacterium RIFCSPLOWO2_12_FULL_38_15]